MRVAVPGVARIVEAQNRAVAVGFVQQTEGQIALYQPVKRLRGVRGRLIAINHSAESIRRRQSVALIQIITADGHFLAGQLVVDHVDLQTGIGSVFGARKALDHITQIIQCLGGRGLVAVHVDDLFEVADGLDVVRIGGGGVARIELHEPVRIGDRLNVVIALVVGIGLHEDRTSGPF